MNAKIRLAVVLLVAILPPWCHSQEPARLPASGQAPLLYVRFNTPAAMQVTFHQGTPNGKSLVAPVTVGLRPGYVYRAKLNNLPEYPGIALFPTLEVRGTLQLPPQFSAADHPVPLGFSMDDVTQVLAGAFLTKVVYLENPERALPVATRPGEMMETEVRPGGDLLEQSRSLGRPVLIVRLGARVFSTEEMARQSVPGTILFPGDKTLAAAAVPPQQPWACMPWYDPKLGPRLSQEECLQDGGIAGAAPGFDREGRLQGLEPSDAVAEYKDSHGHPHIAPSNRVCICTPRFAALRTAIKPTGYETSVAVARSGTALAQSIMLTRLPSLEAEQLVQAEALRGRLRSSEVENLQGTISLVHQEAGALVIGRQHGEAVVGAIVQKPCPLPDRPLVLCKTVDKQSAQVGDVVTFSLKYINQGGQPITGIVVSDSLTGRLEYVADSAKTDREAVLTTQLNQAGSLILRWEFGGELLPGKTGLIQFQARIR